MKEINFEEEISIDPDALDVEWLNQPKLFLKYAELTSDARMEVDKAKERFELVKAELDRDIRLSPEKFNIEKITESVISNTTILQKPYQETSDNYIKTKHKADILLSAVKAFDQRKKALENLVQLHGQSYFAGPKEPRDLEMEFGKRVKQKQVRTRIKNKLNR